MTLKRGDSRAGAGDALAAVPSNSSDANRAASPHPKDAEDRSAQRNGLVSSAEAHAFNASYEGDCLDQIAFPLGGIGAGMICIEGTGALSKFSLRHRPDLSSERRVFAAVSIQGLFKASRVVEGPVPSWKLRPQMFGEADRVNASWGLPRFSGASFEARFPFAMVRLKDEELPVEVDLKGWSPFSPGDADNASLPVAAVEYQFTNKSGAPMEAVFSFNAENFMAAPRDLAHPNRELSDAVRPVAGGFVLCEAGTESRPWHEGYFAAWVEEPAVRVNGWFRGDALAQMQMLWNDIASGNLEARAFDFAAAAPGASLFVPIKLATGGSKTITLYLAWYVPKSNVFAPDFTLKNGQFEKLPQSTNTYQPWYAGRFPGIDEVKGYWRSRYQQLRQATEQFSRALHDSTLPPEVMEAVTANLSILKSPTVLRQIDGRLWGWEGSFDEVGSCYGSSNHVWNYAQAIAHLFPDLERTLRETEFGPNLGKDGFQAIRAALPIRPIGDTREDAWGFPSAADGQLGGIIKMHRDWRISGDTAWLRGLWPKVKSSLDYCIRTWDPMHRGWIEEPHITTYDREFWGADSLCASLYVSALNAACVMARAFEGNADRYAGLLSKAVHQIEDKLFNGEYFFQRTEWRNLRTPFPSQDHDPLAILQQNPDMLKLALEEGPPYQYGEGCLSDGVMGAWLGLVSGLANTLDKCKVESHLMAVYRHNLKKSLTNHANTVRPLWACGEEAGLLTCSWPKGGRPSLPLVFADTVFTGTEYQVASHLIAVGKIDEGLGIVRLCRRRYDGRVRNPFDEIEAGHWYARAMSSYALLQAFSGARFDAVDKILYLKPVIKGDFRCFLSTATGYGTVGVRDGQPFVDVTSGDIPYRQIQYSPA